MRLFRNLIQFVLSCASAIAFANLQVFPTRVVLDDKSRISQLSLTHSDKNPVTYEIVPVFYKQDAEGRMLSTEGTAAAEQAYSAASVLRYSPRVFTLQAGQTQTIKIRAQPSPALADGIYRIHLRIQPVADIKAVEASPTSKARAKSGAASLELRAMLAIAVPIYFSHGSITRLLELSDIHTSDKGSKISFLLKQQGNGFLFGDIILTTKDPKTKEVQRQLGRLLNMASYAPERRIEVAVDPPLKNTNESKENLHIEILQSPEEGGALIYEKEVPLASLAN